MKNIKKLSMILALVLMVSLAAAACGQQAEVETTTAADTASESTTAAVTEATGIDTSTEVKIYGYLLGAVLPGFPDVMTALNEKLKKDINATMEINYIGLGDLGAKYPLILAAGENVDWIYTAAWCQMTTEADKGAFMEITPQMYEKYMYRHYAKIKDTTALKEVAVKGKAYMIPTSTPDKKVDVTIYRKDLVEKYGLPAIEKFSDLEALAEAVKKNEKGMLPIAGDNDYDVGQVAGKYYLQNNEMAIDIKGFTGTALALVYKSFDTDGALYNKTDDPVLASANIEAAKYAKSWYDKGYINHDILANKIRSKEALVQGKSAIAFGNSIDVQGNIAAAEASGMKIGIIPTVDNKQRAGANSYTNNGIAISAKSKNWERALMAMDLIMEDESYVNLVYYGIEGKNYIIKDGKIDLPDGVTSDANTYPLDQAGFWFVNKDFFKPMASWTDSYIALNDSIPGFLKHDTLANFTAVTDNIKTEIANCGQVVAQYLKPADAGISKDVDADYKTVSNKLKSAGIDKIKEEMAKQIQAYLASQN